MISMKTAKCPTCGGIVFKLAGKASKLCHDECIKCREERAQSGHDDGDQSGTHSGSRHKDNRRV